MTAVFVPGTTSRFVRSDVPDTEAAPHRAPASDVPDTEGAPHRAPAPGAAAALGTAVDRSSRPAASDEEIAPAPRIRRRQAPTPDADEDPVETPTGEPDASARVDGYVLFRVGGTTFAVPVVEVREIVRAERLQLLPTAAPQYGHGVALVDTRGRSIPVVDLRSDPAADGDVLLPVWRHQVGLVVDRVTAVLSPRELAPEHGDVPAALPSYARGVLRPADGGDPVVLITMPDAAELELDGARPDGLRLGQDVLADHEPA